MEATYNLAAALFMLGSQPEAEQYFRQVLMLTPSDPDPHFRLGVTLAEQSKCAEALECFERVIRMDPAHVDAHAMAARELAHFERDAEARQMLERVQALNPGLLDEWEELAALWRRLRSGGA